MNDGSFLQQFMKMQKDKPNNVSGKYLDLHSFEQKVTVRGIITAMLDCEIKHSNRNSE